MARAADPAGTPRFAPPGAGAWSMDAAHVHKPLTGILRDVFAIGVGDGMSAACARYGLLLERLEIRFVHGFPYQRAKPVGAPAGKPPPPKPLFLLLARLHPALRRRLRAARDLFERKPWRDELRAWDARAKPEAIAAHTALDIELGALSDGALAGHVTRAAAHALRMLKQDHDFTLAFAIPLGDFLAQATGWTGLPETELLQLFRGASEISSGDSPERRRLLRALAADSDARAAVTSERPPHEVLAQLAAHPGELGEATRAWLVVFGNAILHGLDLTIPSAREAPGPLLQALRRALVAPPPAPESESRLARVRERVPVAERERFDALFAEARAMYRIRDERHVYGVFPSLGLVRRATLEVGRRLTARRLLPRAELAVHADAPELVALLSGGGPPVAELEARAHTHASLDATTAPLTLGGEPPPPPPSEWLPNEGARRASRAVAVYLRAVEQSAPKLRGDVIHGVGVSGGAYEGTARVCASAVDLERIQPGDALIAPTTTSAIAVVMPLLGAIVTDRGGALSHAAIVTRELGIPGVVGTHDATTRIPDGARVRIDGTTGTVTVLA